jgi:hypothetical protein
MGNSDEIYAQAEHDERQAQRQELAQLRSRVRRLEEACQIARRALDLDAPGGDCSAIKVLDDALAPAPAKGEESQC